MPTGPVSNKRPAPRPTRAAQSTHASDSTPTKSTSGAKNTTHTTMVETPAHWPCRQTDTPAVNRIGSGPGEEIPNAIATCPADAAPWFWDMFAVLNDDSLGAEYRNLLQAFSSLEATYGWKTGSKHLSVKGRPQKVTAWINNGRKSFALDASGCKEFSGNGG